MDALDKKDTKDSKGKYHDLLIPLYADYSRDKLLPLLRRSDNYHIEQALDICSQRQFYPEMVYLLGRMGNTSEALALMTRELNDMESAIAFCQEHDDKELWNDLVNYSLDKPGTNHRMLFLSRVLYSQKKRSAHDILDQLRKLQVDPF